MTDWSSLIGHQQIERWFANAIANSRLGGSFLFVGEQGVGKKTFATLLARTLLCESSPPAAMNPCGRCEACTQVLAESHPDLIQLRRPADRSFIPLDLLIGPPDARMQSGFCRDVRLKPFRGRRKIAIIEDADFLNEEGANCLLKTLEEPPPDALVILIGSSEQRQLPTIRSRCQTIRFLPPRGSDAVQLLGQVHGIEAAEPAVSEAMEIAGGDVHAAAALLSGEADQLREAMENQLRQAPPDPIALQRVITGHTDKAGKETRKKRIAMREAFAVAVQHYRQQIRRDAAEQRFGPKTLARLDRSLRALREIDRSANPSTLIQCYAADIAAGTTGDRGDIGS